MDQKNVQEVEENEGKRQYRASELAECAYSRFLEERVQRRVETEMSAKAAREGTRVGSLARPGEITIRVVCQKDMTLEVRTKLAELYGSAPFDSPDSYPFQMKCVLVFERRHAVDLLVFAMYLQAYGSECAQPNHRSLYIAYLDSVHHFSPRYLRTHVFQEVLVGTLAYEKARGFNKAFIWSCPPQAGEDYILYCHPKEQKPSKTDRLRSWYYSILEQSRKEGGWCDRARVLGTHARPP